jgi:predicted metal-dependent peptidase
MNMIKTVPDKITAARVRLLLSHPFFGNMAPRLKAQDASNWCSTAATDGVHLYYNHDFFDKMDISQIEFVICHEILHCIFDHMGRADNRNRKVWNFATDYAVNGQLIRDKIGTPPDVDYLHDTKYYGIGAEEIYDELYNEHQEMLDHLGSLLDDHIDWSGDGAGDDTGNNHPRYTKEQMQTIRDNLIEAVIQASQSSGAGNTPADIERMIKSLTEPKMNWREILRNQIQSIIRNDYTWQRPNRKGWHTGCMLPGMNYAETIDIAIAIDTSGSISDKQLQVFLSEINGIMQEYQEFKIKIWTFDVSVHNPQEYTSDNGENLLDYEIKGGGGTDFMCNWNYMQENDYVPKRFIMFTDMGAFGSFGLEDYCPTIFVAHGTNVIAPFGDTIFFDETV